MIWQATDNIFYQKRILSVISQTILKSWSIIAGLSEGQKNSYCFFVSRALKLQRSEGACTSGHLTLKQKRGSPGFANDKIDILGDLALTSFLWRLPKNERAKASGQSVLAESALNLAKVKFCSRIRRRCHWSVRPSLNLGQNNQWGRVIGSFLGHLPQPPPEVFQLWNVSS